MGYTKQNFADGQTLKAEHLIKMEEGIINAESSGGSGTVDTSGLQEKLVSGTNIKTINGKSLLGSGDITVEGGSGGEGTSYDLKASDYGVVVGTVDMDAMNALLVVAKEANKTIRFDDGEYLFPNTIVVPSNVWLKGGANTVLRLTSSSSDSTLISITNATNVRLDNLKLKGYNTTACPTTKGSKVGVSISSSDSVLITNTNVSGFNLYGVYATNIGAVDATGKDKWFDSLQMSNCVIELCYYGLYLGYRAEYNNITNVKCGYNNTGCFNGGGNNSYCNCLFNCNVTGFYLESEGMSNPAHGGCTGCAFNHNTSYGVVINKMQIGWTFSGCQFFYGENKLIDSKGALFTGCIFGSSKFNCKHSSGLEKVNLLSSSYFQTDSATILANNDGSLFVYNCLPDHLPDSTVTPPEEQDITLSFSVNPTKSLASNAYIANMQWDIPSGQQIDYIELPAANAAVGTTIPGVDVWAVNAETREVIEHLVDNQDATVVMSTNLNTEVVRLEIGKAFDVPICFAFQNDRVGTNDTTKPSIYYGDSGVANSTYLLSLTNNTIPAVGDVLPANNSPLGVSCGVYAYSNSDKTEE